jgi:hypothetical protein
MSETATGTTDGSTNTDTHNAPGVGGSGTTEGTQSTGLLGNTGTVHPSAPPSPASAPPKKIDNVFGGADVQWPEGTPDEIKTELSLKPYIGPDGKVNVGNALKSLVHSQKTMGKDRIVMPHQDSTESEWVDFHTKVFGYDTDFDAYTQKIEYDPEKSPLEDAFVEKLVKHAHEQKYPPALVQDMLTHMSEAVAENMKNEEQELARNKDLAITSLQKEWGAAFKQRLEMARTVIDKFAPPEFIEYLNNSPIKNDVNLTKFLSNLGATIFGEDTFQGKDSSGMTYMTPHEAELEINTIFGDQKHPYHDRNHPNHQKATEFMTKLFAMRGRITPEPKE